MLCGKHLRVVEQVGVRSAGGLLRMAIAIVRGCTGRERAVTVSLPLQERQEGERDRWAEKE